MGLLAAAAPSAGAASWEGAIESFGNATAPSSVVSDDGTVFAVYVGNGLEFAVRAPGEPWRTPEAIPGSAGAYNPQIGVDAAGVLTVVWQASSTSVIEAQRSAAGEWSAPREIFTTAAAEGDAEVVANTMRLSVSATGAAVIAWRAGGAQESCVQDPGGGSGKWYVRAMVREPSGADWSEAVIASSMACDIASPRDVHVAMSDAGEATLAWEYSYSTYYTDSRGSRRFCLGDGVQARTVAPDGAWQPVEEIGEPAGCTVFSDDRIRRFFIFGLDLTVDSDGRRTIAYSADEEDQRREQDDVFSIEATTAGPGEGFPASESVIASNSDNSLFSGVSLAGNARGDTALVTWVTQTGVVTGAVRPAGGVWGGPETIADTRDGNTATPRVAVDADGTATAAWINFGYETGSYRQWTEAASRPLAGGWDAPQEISGAGDGGRPIVVAGGLAQATVFWRTASELMARATDLTGQAKVVAGRLVYTAGAGELNRATVYLSGGKVRISDPGSTGITPQAGCSSVSATVVACDMPSRVELSLFDGPDKAINATTMIPVTIDGGGGDDVLSGGAPVDTLVGGDGDDTLDGNVGADSIIGGDGSDTVTYATRPAAVAVTLDGVANDGQIDIDPGTAGNQGERDRVLADVENAIGGSGADRLTGDAGVNLLDGKGGDDLLDGRGGADTLYGGTDTDTVTYASRTAPLSVVLDTKANDGEVDVDPLVGGNQGEGDLVRIDVENVIGGSAGDRFTGGSAANLLDGRGGDDVLDGRLGADTLFGGIGTDTATYSTRRAAVRIALDARPNDGEIDIDPATAGDQSEGDLVRNDIENATGGSGNDILSAIQANAVINVLAGGLGADHITTKDGTTTRDKVLCGDGPAGAVDTAVTDASDSRSLCEAA